MERNYLITGGAGFIGSHLVNQIINDNYTFSSQIIVVDKLDYAANLDNLKQCFEDPRFSFYQIDIKDSQAMLRILNEHKINTIIHLAAKSHVDNSIDSPLDFITNNVVGAINLISSVKLYLDSLNEFERANFKFVNISTDEVFGDREGKAPANELTAYNPSSPYSASKGATDLIFNSFVTTYNIPVLTLYLCNNYGPRQYPEKLVPVSILQLMRGQKVKLYGNGKQVRGWMYVKDTASLILKIVNEWIPRKSDRFVIGGEYLSNTLVVNYIAQALEEIYPLANNSNVNCNLQSYNDLIEFTSDRPGHDRKYQVDDALLQTKNIPLPVNNFKAHIKDTIKWYLENSRQELSKLNLYDYQESKSNPFTRNKRK
ncbi:hypothetical protein CJP74_02885 [Psittacicella melopsittaci]|uniref:NAD(P)-binding domain-containing protein n=1 Tax=Psittacicella melopsittaci TaxID=2028576 RepID=A0A3A1Y796_9GAMM|nr:GDP-mannose 4,6-dehydratase [Psittacicella melopsittaci]RIY33088.1 hypothetical protein CJP74_02885 [Psittacicella melopsittaci]